MRLVLVSQRFAPLVGGAERLLEYLAAALVRDGARVTVLTARWSRGVPAEEVREGVRVVRLPIARVRIWGTVKYILDLEDWLQTHAGQFDLCYTSMLKHSAFAAVRAARTARFPVVLRCEGQGPVGDVAWQRTARLGTIIVRQCQQADRIVALNSAVGRELVDAGYPPGRIVEIPNGVPVPPPYTAAAVADHRRRTLPGLPEPARIALFTGRLSPEKNLATLIAAWPAVRAAEPAACLVLVADGPEAVRLRSQARAAGLAGAIIWAGATTCVAPFLRSADVFVLPSSSEGMSIALLEAMALGLPVVASDIPGNRGLVEPGVSGLLAPPDDPRRLAAAIVRQFQDRPAALRMAGAARQRVEAEFSIDAMARRHMDLFEGLVSPRMVKDLIRW